MILCRLQELGGGNSAFDQMHLQVLIPLTLQVIGAAGKGFLLIGLSLCLLTVIPVKGIVFFFLHAGDILRNLLLQVVRQFEIIADDRPQKIKCPCPVCQHVEHLQIDPPAVIVDPVKEPAPPIPIDGRAGRLVLPLHHGTDITAVQVIPEQPLAQNTRKMGKIRNCPVQCLLQQHTVHFFLQLTGEPENTRIGALRCRGDNLRVIIQFIPLRPCHILCLSDPPLWKLSSFGGRLF